MFRQRNDKDCAVTALAHLTGVPYTTVINSFPEYRFKRARTRSKCERADLIIGRYKKIMVNRSGFDGTLTKGDPEWGQVVYNRRYRSKRPPYFSHYGLMHSEYKKWLESLGYLLVDQHHASLKMLQRVPFALLSLDSINVKNSGHVLIWRAGRIWDPSPKKRFDYARLRRTDHIGVLAITRGKAQHDHLRKVLRIDLTGADIMSMLIWKVKVMTDEERRLVVEGEASNVRSDLAEWWESGQTAPPEIEALVMTHTKP